jgi:hypothetical protein
MIAPGYDDGSDSPFVNMKFPLINDPILQATGIAPAANVFLTPVNFKPENSISAVQKAYAMQQQENASESNNHIKDSTPLKQSSHLITTPDSIPTFRTGELTVSLKNAKNEYDYSPTDFTKIESMKGRSDYPLADLSQPMKFPDLSKLTSFSPSELAKLTGFSLNDFTKAASTSAYVRNIASLFGPLSKGIPDPSENNDRRSSDFPDITAPFKPPTASSPSPKESSRITNINLDDYSSTEKKKPLEPMDTSSSFSGTEDLSIINSKPDFGAMIDMTTKKQQHQHSIDSGDSLNLSKDRQ